MIEKISRLAAVFAAFLFLLFETNPVLAAGDFIIDVLKPEKVYPGTTIFGDSTDAEYPEIVEVDMNGKIIWQYRLPDEIKKCRGSGGMDVEWVPETDTFLINWRGSGVFEINRDKEIVWSFKTDFASHDVDRLANGNTLMVWGWDVDKQDPQVTEVNARGEVVWRWYAAKHLKEKQILDKEGFTHANSVVRLDNGNTLVSLRNFYMLVEVNRSGNIVWKLQNLITTPHDPEVLPNGNILVNTRGPQVIKEITPAGKIVWQYRPKPGSVSTVRYNHKQPNGNIIFAERTKIMEITPSKEVVWQMRLKDVGVDRNSKNNWFYKAERIPLNKKRITPISFTAPSKTLEKLKASGAEVKVESREDFIAKQARGMIRRMDQDDNNTISIDE
jgi:hypothetical protein